MSQQAGQFDVRVTRAAVTPCEADWRWINTGAFATEANIWLVADGQGWLERRGRRLAVRSGDCFVFRHVVPHRAGHDAAHPLLVPWICFECLDGDGRAADPPPESALPPLYRRVDSVGFLGELIGRCVEAYDSERPGDAARWLRAVLMEVHRQDARPLETSLQREQARLIDTLCREAERSIGLFRRVADLAARADYSTDHFIRVFKAVRQTTPGEFLIRTRVRRACDLLRFSGRSITDIAEAIGYGDVYAFSKQFRQRMGQSPTAYRRGEAV
ncbi:MAG: helix-turn-helix domain-containing protein [Planctomycetes bacterium]|jgi:AraC-like DNA-binding protein|nr:helix-turn-helix domain-containing protein [Planctomycetota bacterium]